MQAPSVSTVTDGNEAASNSGIFNVFVYRNSGGQGMDISNMATGQILMANPTNFPISIQQNLPLMS